MPDRDTTPPSKAGASRSKARPTPGSALPDNTMHPSTGNEAVHKYQVTVNIRFGCTHSVPEVLHFRSITRADRYANQTVDVEHFWPWRRGPCPDCARRSLYLTL